MKKLVISLVLFLFACSSEQVEVFKVGSYKMVDSLNNVPTIIRFSEDGKFSGKVVNNIMGSYTIGKNKSLSFGDAATTMMMGPEEAMEAEQNFLQILPKIRSYKMQGNYLVLITENGGQLLFEPFSESE
jgi:heat shock protein HslJ